MPHFAALSKSITVGEMTQETTLVSDAETVGTHKIDLMTITQKVDSNQPGAANQAMITGLMFGAMGLQTRMTALADGYLQVQGGDKETMEVAIKAYEAKSNSLTEARAGMAEESHLLLLLDLPGLVRNGMLAATTINIPGVAIPFQRAAVEDLQISPSYTAISAVGEAHAVRIKTKVPVEQFQGVLKLVGDRRAGVLVGATILQPRAGEMLSELSLAVKAKTPLAVLADLIHPFPAFSRILGHCLQELAKQA